MTEPAACAPIPVLRILDEGRAREFYIGYLGFAPLFEARFEPGAPLYLGLRMGDCVLHLSEHYGDGTPGGLVRIGLPDIAAFLAGLDTGFRYARPSIEDRPWGFRELAITDPFSNRLVFCQEIGAIPDAG